MVLDEGRDIEVRPVHTPEAVKVDEHSVTGHLLGPVEQAAVAARRGSEPLRAGWKDELAQQLVGPHARVSERARRRAATSDHSCGHSRPDEHDDAQDEQPTPTRHSSIYRCSHGPRQDSIFRLTIYR
jgi:hypothetical protein